MRLFALLPVLVMAIGGTARADELEGVVRAEGSALNMQVMLSPPGQTAGPDLCRGDVMTRVRKLGNLTVKATGNWKLNDKGEKDCFEATDFTVTKTTMGRDAVVGMVAQKDGQLTITGDDGKAMTLAEAPDGLKKMAGQKVILDLKPMGSPALKDVTAYKVVSYTSFP